MSKGMDHTAVSATEASSVTLQIWQRGAKQTYCNVEFFNSVVDTNKNKSEMSILMRKGMGQTAVSAI